MVKYLVLHDSQRGYSDSDADQNADTAGRDADADVHTHAASDADTKRISADNQRSVAVDVSGIKRRPGDAHQRQQLRQWLHDHLP